MDTSGFYKKDIDGVWYFAPNFVYNKDYELEKDGNREAVDGWEWYDIAPTEYLQWIDSQEII